MSSRIAYRGRSIVVAVDEVELPNGRRVELDVVRHPGAVGGGALRDAERDVLLIRQFRHAAGGTIWEVPAGKLDGDAPEVCARKELEEEAGRRAGRLEKLGSIWTTPGFTDEVIHLFAAFDLEEMPMRHEPDEVIEVVRDAARARARDGLERRAPRREERARAHPRGAPRRARSAP